MHSGFESFLGMPPIGRDFPVSMDTQTLFHEDRFHGARI